MYRVGIGSDIHRLIKGKSLVLGGFHIPYHRKLKGHSDGDVVLHSLVDAILGALGEGDIGEKFPDNDSRYRDIDSAFFLKETLALMRRRKFKLINMDTVIHAEKPKLGPYKAPMRRRLAALLNVDRSDVSVKAKTAEGLGDIGKQKAIRATTVVLLKKSR